MENNNTSPSIYTDQEVKTAIQELFGYDVLKTGMMTFLPPALYEEILEEKDKVECIFDFQTRIIRPILKFIEQNSITKLTASGMEHLDPGQRYLFISNHRDIILDSAYLNIVLHEKGFQTSQIAIGDNLMKHRISELIFRINKSFVVKRTGSPIELYRYSVSLSEYIRKTIMEKTDSVWIAQREGRAKDGNDRTQTGLLKMLSLSATSDLKNYFRDLKIVPVSISYEFDPCALLKTLEFLKKQSDPEHKKSFEEDVQHMLMGLKGQKGEVHFHFGEVLDGALEAFDSAQNSKKQLEILASLIDDSIHLNYELHPVNYAAHDLLHGAQTHQEHYSADDWQKLNAYFEKLFRQLPELNKEEGKKYLLGIYANPLTNYLAISGGH